MKKLIFFILSIFIFSFFVVAYHDYEFIGQDLYRTDSIAFFDNTAGYTGFKSLVTGTQQPYVSDLDNDGNPEIIIVDDDNIRLFSGVDLSIIDSFDTNAGGDISQLYIYDMNDNGLKDIIFHNCVDNYFWFLEFNGTNFNNTPNSVNLTQADIVCNEDKAVISCDEATDDCLFVAYDSVAGGKAQFMLFNYSAHGFGIFDSEADPICPPSNMGIYFGNVDTNPDFEWVTTATHVNNGAGFHDFRLYILNDYNHNLSLEFQTITETNTNMVAGAGNCQTFPFENLVTAPLVFNYDGSLSNGLEIIVGAIEEKNGNDYDSKLYAFSGDGSLYQSLPVGGTGEGYPVSNPIKTDIFDTSGEFEACILLFAPDSSEQDGTYIDLLCGSKQANLLVESFEFFYPINYNLSEFPTVEEGLIYTIDENFIQYGYLTFKRDPKEIVTTFGIFTPNTETCNAFNQCELILSQDYDFDGINPLRGSVLPIEFDGTPRSDFIILTNQTLYYLDDGFSKRDCSQQNCITSVEVNPCIDTAVAKANSTLRIDVIGSEADGDVISCNGSIYSGEFNEQPFATQSGVAPEAFFFIGTLNQTTGASFLTVNCWESDDVTQIDTFSMPFAVADEGVTFGVCSSSVLDQEVDPDDEEAGEEGVTELDPDDNAIASVVDDFGDRSNLGREIIWLLAMLIVGIIVPYLMIFKDNDAVILAVIVTGILELIMVILGVKLGFFSIGLIITISVIALAIVGVLIGRAITGARS